MNITVTGLREIAEHLDAFELAEPAAVHIDRFDRQAIVQLDAAGVLGTVAAQLLAWADTITVDGLEVWRPNDSDRVHVRLTGHLPSLTALLVYGGVSRSPQLLRELQPSGRQSLSPTVLREWVETHEGSTAA